MRAAGYELAAPRNSAADRVLHAWHRGWKESVWTKSSPGLQIDLHTRTADNPRLIPGIDVHALRQSVELGGGIRLPTLADDELFAYLAVHGASSAWFRLKWISDFAAFVHNRPGRDIQRLYERSQELGAARAAGQALLLADELFGTLDALPELRRRLNRDRTTRLLFEIALRLVTGPPIEPTQRRLGTLPIHRTQFLLLPGLAYKVSEVARLANRLLAWPRS
ncbi:MAG TPA: nucleotidyltransferase family protein [Dongiaceae bacterium]|nr:nucleotidyltransferase family protein [Dongiaceae bacterium]